MSDEDQLRASMGELLALVVHDLRNPVATISANVSFVKEVGAGDDADAIEALDDIETALGDLMRGLEHLGWVGRWVAGHSALEGTPGDARASVQAAVRKLGADVRLELPDESVQVVAGGGALSRLTELLLRNSLAHASSDTVHVALCSEGGHAVLEIRDSGPAVGEDLRAEAFTLDGQQLLKGRSDGRYSRVVGLLAARAIADGMGATLEATDVNGRAAFRAFIPLASS